MPDHKYDDKLDAALGVVIATLNKLVNPTLKRLAVSAQARLAKVKTAKK